MVGRLDSPRFADRERATAELEALGEDALPLLRKLAAGGVTAEQNRRLQRVLERLAGPPWGAEQLRQLRAVEALSIAGTPDAKRMLAELAAGHAEARLTREATAALDRPAR
jgi:hypothetical protein